MVNLNRDPSESREKGFVLVTSLVLLSILTVLGIASTYKTIVELKMSRVSGDSVRALDAASAAMNKQFYDWAMDATIGGGREEFATLINNVEGGTVSGIYKPRLLPLNTTELIAAAGTSGLDAYIQNNSFFRVYNVTESGVSETANANWDPDADHPQVAVWVTSFNVPVKGGVPDPDKYPYVDPCGPSTSAMSGLSKAPVEVCDGDSSIAINAVGRYRDAKRLTRQLVSTAVSPILEGVNAITNAPKYNSWHDACQGTTSSSSNTATWSTGSDWNTIVDGTQAIYELGDAASGIPSGTAIASNSNASNGSTGGGGSTEAELVMSASPLVAYSGHSPVEGYRVRSGGTSKEPDGSKSLTQTDPKLPRFLIPTQLLGTAHEISYFLDGNSQLFDLNVYRWAAEQFTCQDASTNHAGNGAFCDNADDLMGEVDDAMLGITVDRPVTGRLSLAEFEFNVRNSIPMFGIIRVMYPALESDDASDVSNCAAFGTVTLHELDNGQTTTVGTGSNAVDPHPLASGFNVETIEPGNGRFFQYTASSKIIVYGMLMFDFFSDQDGNGVFDPDTGDGSGDYLLDPMAAYGIDININVPVYVNPSLPRITTRASGDTDARFPTAAATSAPSGSASDLANGGLVNTGDSSKVANLASPYDGWFPEAEGMLNLVSGTLADGTMNLMKQEDLTASTASGLLAAMNQMYNLETNVIGSKADALYTGAKSRLEYYHELNKLTLDQDNDQFWPISTSLPADLTSSTSLFCIGDQDCDTDNDHPGDRFHLLFPSGYTHGWKVALAALDMTAAEWNTLLTGNGTKTISQLRTAHAAPVPPGNLGLPAGSPFGNLDEGYVTANVTGYQGDSSSYFSVTAHSSGYGLLDSQFRDVPSLVFSGGKMYMNYHLNLSGIVYTAGAIEWCAGRVGASPNNGLSYVTGAEVTGFGSYTRNKGTGSETYDEAHNAIVFDPVAVDFINTNQSAVIIMRTYGWQELF